MSLTTPTFNRGSNNGFIYFTSSCSSSKLSLPHPPSPARPHSSPSLLPLPRPPISFSFSLLAPPLSAPRCRVTRVSTAPVEYAPPAPEFDFRAEIGRLEALRSHLSAACSVEEKLRVLDADPRVGRFLSSSLGNGLAGALGVVDMDDSELFLIKCLVAAGQEHVLGAEKSEGEFVSARSSLKSALHAIIEMIERLDANGGEIVGESKFGARLEDEKIEDLKKLLKTLAEIEKFYDCIGGIIGYQIMVLELLSEAMLESHPTNWSQHSKVPMEAQFLEIHSPAGLDLSRNTEYASQAALWGIEGLPNLGEIYPLGGSADRLGLVDPDTGECLPAAMLPYCGQTLLEGLVRDVQAREYLYFKLYGKQCITPIAIMTSSAKNNHERVTYLCEKLKWFGRGRSSFQLFEQPLVPTISAEDGRWIIIKPFMPVCKPGGHGAIWKLAYDRGVFQWFYNHGRTGATVRQVSNVVAATDVTLLALAGIGLRHKKKVGFASCKRNLGATEGINVLIEKKNLDGDWAYGLSCVEYTEFDKFGIADGSPNRLLFEFPANTNILYVDLISVELVGSCKTKSSLPGMVLNTKKPVEYVDHFGNKHSVSGGRLECTMQNIVDSFLNTYPSRRYRGVEDELDTFLVYNERRRVTSSAKKKRKPSDKSLHQTPDGALLDMMRNAYDLLSLCNIKLPEIEGNEKYVHSRPPFLILLHPALGPLWEVTRQKFSGGSISRGSELKVEVAEFLWRDVQLEGSLIVEAENAMGSTHADENGDPILQYGHRCGRCKLQNVKVLNEGIDWIFTGNVFWKHDVQHLEMLKVVLQGNAEFEATDVSFQGNHVFEVPDGHKMKITPGVSGFSVQLEALPPNLVDSGSWYWRYKINGTHIQLELVQS